MTGDNSERETKHERYVLCLLYGDGFVRHDVGRNTEVVTKRVGGRGERRLSRPCLETIADYTDQRRGREKGRSFTLEMRVAGRGDPERCTVRDLLSPIHTIDDGWFGIL